MISMVRLCGFCCLAIAARSAHAQEAVLASPPDSNVVTSFSVKSGRIALSSLKNPGPAYMPDGTYTNEGGAILVILDGHITRFQRSPDGEVTEIASVRLNQLHGIRLTPSTNALMAVSEIPLPSGTFTSVDGANSMRVLSGRPTLFTIGLAPPTH